MDRLAPNSASARGSSLSGSQSSSLSQSSSTSWTAVPFHSALWSASSGSMVRSRASPWRRRRRDQPSAGRRKSPISAVAVNFAWRRGARTGRRLAAPGSSRQQSGARAAVTRIPPVIASSRSQKREATVGERSRRARVIRLAARQAHSQIVRRKAGRNSSPGSPRPARIFGASQGSGDG